MPIQVLEKRILTMVLHDTMYTCPAALLYSTVSNPLFLNVGAERRARVFRCHHSPPPHHRPRITTNGNTTYNTSAQPLTTADDPTRLRKSGSNWALTFIV